jgi:hypothetical protein
LSGFFKTEILLLSCLLRCLRSVDVPTPTLCPLGVSPVTTPPVPLKKICDAQCRSVRRPAYVTARTRGRTGARAGRRVRPCHGRRPRRREPSRSLPCLPTLASLHSHESAKQKLKQGWAPESKKTDWGGDRWLSKPSVTYHRHTFLKKPTRRAILAGATARSGSVSPLAEQLNKRTDHLSGYPPFHPYHNGLATEKGKWPT